MATRTSVGSGLWSAAGTWDTGVPLDDDIVVIAAGHVVTFDVDQSAFANGINGLTITGTLNLTLTAGTYYLKIKNATVIRGAGTFNCGTLENPIPAGTNHTIRTGTGQSYISGTDGLTCNCYGTEPATPFVTMTSQTNGGGTVLNVDTDITSVWNIGDTVWIVSLSSATVETRTIVNKSATTITVVALASNKPAGSKVILVNRNLLFTTAANPDVSSFGLFQKGKLKLVSCRVYNLNAYGSGGGYFGDGIEIDGGVYHTSGLFTGGNDIVVNGGFFSSSYTSLTNYSLFAGSKNLTIKGGYFIGCYSLAVTSNGINVFGGTYWGNGNIFSNSTNLRVFGGTYAGNTYCLNQCSGDGFGMNLSFVTAENINYNNSRLGNDYTFNSVNHNGSDGALKAWSKGGVVTSQNTTIPSGYSQAYTHALESAVYPCFWRKYFGVPAGSSLTIEVQLRKTASMAYLPRVYLMESVGNPLAGATPVDSFTMTNSTDTWETHTFTIDNSAGAYDKEYVLWFVGQNATGSVYSAYNFTPPTGGGGAVKIVPLGGIRL